MMNVDPNGQSSWKVVRTDMLANGINAIIGLIAGGYGIYAAVKALRSYYLKKRVEMKIVSYITKFGVYKSVAVGIAATITTFILNMMGGVGFIAVYVLTRYFSVVTKKAKQFVYWGPIIKVDYINFGKRR
ncbi:hypothetical protein [Viridibacillus arvi]|uniref:hypothetical protein n=1 Tax=Viridibacillus arvi TaxID=263475 RepID=UPI003D2D121D